MHLKLKLTNSQIQFETCYFRRHKSSSMFSKFLRVLEEKENRCIQVFFSFEQFQPSIAPPHYLRLTK
ncbi:hypothetical protein O6P43_024660 [Quillaja saponaria]|uniref:Uncharacterized protein n=1 Tax=Quillaja saponaria TaxID=32244 RepID=A0AAD7PFF8_QUISA|nr:hypothetical protein O6P43_024660 [Quillaja saponaria]